MIPSNFIFALFLVKFASSHDLDPISGKVEVVEHGSYQIGIDDYGEYELKECSFYSDTGCNVTFPIGIITETATPNKNLCEQEAYVYTNVVTDRGADDLCKIVVSNVDQNGPKTWNLIAFDEYTGTKINETFYISFLYAAGILKYEIRLTEGESLFNHLKMGNKKLVSCKLNYNDTEIDLDLQSEKSTVTHISSNIKLNRDAHQRVTSLGRNLCGFILSNVSRILDDAVHYNLTTVDDQGLKYRQGCVIRVNYRPPPYNLNQARWITLGNELVVSCGFTVTQPFCLIFNPQGQVVTEECTYTSKVATVHHLGRWKCYAGNRESMTGLEYTIELFKKDRGKIDTWQIETTNYLSIGCQLANATARFLYCKMIAPNGHIINVLDFVASERYSSMGTKLRDRICSLQIKKPLMNSEIGLWKCEFKQEYQNPTGSFLHINSMAIPDYPKELKLTAEMGKPLKVTCQVPYYSDYCIIKAPNGTIYHIKKLTDVNMGKCQYSIEDVQTGDNGTWSCTFGRRTGLPDDEVKVEVSIAELLRYSKRIEADSGDLMTLTCNSAGIPLQYCRFISPSGVGYHLGNHQNLGRIGYYGKGMEFGECGISIKNIQASEAGEWKCITKFFNEVDEELHEKELIGNIFVDIVLPRSPVRGINVGAIGIGTSVGIVVIGIIIAMFALRKWKQKQNIATETVADNNQLVSY